MIFSAVKSKIIGTLQDDDPGEGRQIAAVAAAEERGGAGGSLYAHNR
jgi:hypothetical protein